MLQKKQIHMHEIAEPNLSSLFFIRQTTFNRPANLQYSEYKAKPTATNKIS